MSHYATNNSKRFQHELFSKHVGYNTPTELALTCISPILLYWSRSLVLLSWQPKFENKIFPVLFDFFTIILPVLYLLTLGSNHIVPILVTMFALTFSWSLIVYFKHRGHLRIASTSAFNLAHNFAQSFDINRFTIYFLSCSMIYCIDLPICPRRFAKTESGGVGLMDVGTGLFVVASAGSGPNDVEKFSRKHHRQSWLECFGLTAFPCLILGILRTLILQHIDYQHSEVEYGVHWNFFYTVFVIRLLSLIIFYPNLTWGRWLMNMYIPYRCIIHIGLAAICLILSEYSGPMLYPGLKSGWQVDRQALNLISSHRNDSIVIANFEGIVSLFGYTSIYFYCSATFIILKFVCNSKSTRSLPIKQIVGVILLFGMIPATILYHQGWNSISRRFTNSSYVALISLMSVLIIPFSFSLVVILVQLSHHFHMTYQPSLLLSSLARYGMPYFLLSNLLTGFLNFCFDSLKFLNSTVELSPITGNFHVGWTSAMQQFALFIVYEVCSIVPIVWLYFCNSKSNKDQ